MIDLYTWTTDNGFKARQCAEESGLEYTLKPVNLRKKAQEFKVDFRQGELFSSQMGMQEFVRLGFCFYDPEGIEEGIKRLRDCLGK